MKGLSSTTTPSTQLPDRQPKAPHPTATSIHTPSLLPLAAQAPISTRCIVVGRAEWRAEEAMGSTREGGVSYEPCNILIILIMGAAGFISEHQVHQLLHLSST